MLSRISKQISSVCVKLLLIINNTEGCFLPKTNYDCCLFSRSCLISWRKFLGALSHSSSGRSVGTVCSMQDKSAKER